MRMPEQPEVNETGRVEAFSDGVFAIAITLLVLNLKTPDPAELKGGTLLGFLAHQWPSYLAFLLSFLTILVMWVNHHLLFRFIKRCDGRFLFINGLLLLMVTITPFPTSILAAYLMHPDARTAAQLYSGLYLVIAIAFNLLWQYAIRGDRLVSGNADRVMIEKIDGQYTAGLMAYIVAFGLSFINAAASITLCILLALYFCFTGSISIPVLGKRK